MKTILQLANLYVRRPAPFSGNPGSVGGARMPSNVLASRGLGVSLVHKYPHGTVAPQRATHPLRRYFLELGRRPAPPDVDTSRGGGSGCARPQRRKTTAKWRPFRLTVQSKQHKVPIMRGHWTVRAKLHPGRGGIQETARTPVWVHFAYSASHIPVNEEASRSRVAPEPDMNTPAKIPIITADRRRGHTARQHPDCAPPTGTIARRAVEMRADVTVAQSGAQIFMSCASKRTGSLMSTGGAAIKATSRSSTGGVVASSHDTHRGRSAFCEAPKPRKSAKFSAAG
ncbi:hypothetical protein VTO73DRAFT_10747 [Trametes versicolor]